MNVHMLPLFNAIHQLPNQFSDVLGGVHTMHRGWEGNIFHFIMVS